MKNKMECGCEWDSKKTIIKRLRGQSVEWRKYKKVRCESHEKKFKMRRKNKNV